MIDDNKEKVEQLADFIMKNCLWQFHSRTWDRERQNERILDMTTKIVCGEDFEHESAEDRCYWADAMYMADSFDARFPWFAQMSLPQRREIMDSLKERIDFLTIKGSLNEELKDINY